MNTSRPLHCLIASLLLAAPAVFAQGSLTPPGPPAPAMKTLSQLEPRTPISSLPYSVSVPGSYYVTSNLTGIASSSGILIFSGDVTIDLGGFTLTGVPGSLVGIATPTGLTNIVIRNGIVRDWGATGVDTTINSQAHVENILSLNNAGGFTIGTESTIENCRVVNTKVGVGISVDDNSEILNCSAQKCKQAGMRTGQHCTIRHSEAIANTGEGMNANFGSTIIDCVASANGTNGFTLANYCTITESHADQNAADGISLSSYGDAERNHCSRNGAGAGVHVLGSYNRIDDNHAAGPALYGIRVDSGNNVVVRNSAAGNSVDYSYISGNTIGPIIGPSQIATNTNPHANYQP